MFREPLRTYVKKNNGKLNSSSITTKSSTINFDSLGIKNTKEKDTFNDTLEDPFDTTFDRLLKEVKSQPPPPPPNAGLSYINSSLDISDDPSTPKLLTVDSDEDSVFKWKSKVLKKKSRIKKQNLDPEEPKKSMKAAMKTEKIKVKKNSTKVSKRKNDEQQIKLSANRKKRKIVNNSEDTLIGFDREKKQSMPQSSSKADDCNYSNNILEDFSVPQTPISINSLLRKSEDNSEFKDIMKKVSKENKSGGKNNEFSSKESLCLTENIHSKKTNSLVNTDILGANLKPCFVALEQCDWTLKKKDVFKLKPCSVQVPRLNVNHYKEVDKFLINQNAERKSEEETKGILANEFVKNCEKEISEKEPKKEQNSDLRENEFIPEDKNVRKLGAIRDCRVILNRTKPLENSFSERLISSTPLTKQKNVNPSVKEFLPVKLDISNITSTPESLRIPPISVKSSIISKKVVEPVVQLEDICKSRSLNYSSEYSEIDWTTVSYSESQFENEISLQEKRMNALQKQKSESKSVPVANSKKDSSPSKILPTTIDLSTENLSRTEDSVRSEKSNLSVKQFNFVTKRNLRLNEEYEKSTSMFDDTKTFQNNCMPFKEFSHLITDEGSLTESDFKDFKEEISTSNMKENSSLTSAATTIVDSLSSQDTEKYTSFVEDVKLEDEKPDLRSLATENSVKHLNSNNSRKSFDFDEESTVYNESVNSNSISSNKEPLNKSSFSESFDQESFNKVSLSQDTFNNNFQGQESLNVTQEMNEKRLTNLSACSSFNVEDSQSSEKNESITLSNEKKVNLDSSRDSSPVDDSSISLDNDDNEKTVKYENRNSCKVESQEILKDKVREQISEAVNTNGIKIRQSFVSLTRLKDPVRITYQRKKYRNWGLQLAAISENESRESNATEVSEENVNPLQENVLSTCETVSEVCNTLVNNGKEMEVPEQQLFLKPGKSWARSLSILNNIHSIDDMDKHSVGKGKQWRNSVINILDMQNKGIVQSCVNQEEELKSQSCKAPSLNDDCDSRLERLSTLGSVSPYRFVKRISIRVVPDAKKLDNVEDTQFLEAYGIASSQSVKALSQKCSISRDNTLIEPQENLDYNNKQEDSVLITSDSPSLVTAKDVVLERCHQEDYLPFNQCYPEKFLQHCQKIGEGVYGEVFLYKNELESSVIKIIPIEGSALVNGELQKKFHEILSEIVIAKELHDLRFNETYNTSGFIEVKSIKCIVGKYPLKLIELWKLYDDEKKSENDCPSMFGKNQLYISLELGHGGQDLEAFVFQNASESYAVFIQTAFALAVAEQSLEFEHRDLHWGNILIQRTKKSNVTYKLGNKEISFSSNGTKVAIIDFTLSRMSYQGCCIFNDLSLDTALFAAEGEYQFEIYRLMRDKTDNNWQKFEPFTNILWLHYTLDKMIKLVRYKKKTTKAHREGIELLENLKDEILSYKSAYDLVTSNDRFTSLYDNPNSSIAAANQRDVDSANKL